MKKLFLLFAAALMAVSVMAEAKYTIISRNNDTIRMYPNALGGAIKSAFPGGQNKEAQYRLLLKEEDGKESYVFIDFAREAFKVIVAYESAPHYTDWKTTIIGQKELYDACQRVNDILLRGQIMSMPIEIYQRPLPFQDLINIDGYEFPLPFKIATYEANLGKAKPRTLKELIEDEKAAKSAENNITNEE